MQATHEGQGRVGAVLVGMFGLAACSADSRDGAFSGDAGIMSASGFDETGGITGGPGGGPGGGEDDPGESGDGTAAGDHQQMAPAGFRVGLCK